MCALFRNHSLSASFLTFQYDSWKGESLIHTSSTKICCLNMYNSESVRLKPYLAQKKLCIFKNSRFRIVGLFVNSNIKSCCLFFNKVSFFFNLIEYCLDFRLFIQTLFPLSTWSTMSGLRILVFAVISAFANQVAVICGKPLTVEINDNLSFANSIHSLVQGGQDAPTQDDEQQSSATMAQPTTTSSTLPEESMYTKLEKIVIFYFL